MKGSIIPELIINQPPFTVSVISTYIPIYLMIPLYIIFISPARGLAATAQLDYRRPKHRSIAFFPTDHPTDSMATMVIQAATQLWNFPL